MYIEHNGVSRTLIGAQELSDSFERTFQIKYYRTEKKAEFEKIYGVCIEKYVDEGVRGDSFEAYISSDRRQIDKILDKLISCSVTAVSAAEVIDSLYDQDLP